MDHQIKNFRGNYNTFSQELMEFLELEKKKQHTLNYIITNIKKKIEPYKVCNSRWKLPSNIRQIVCGNNYSITFLSEIRNHVKTHHMIKSVDETLLTLHYHNQDPLLQLTI